MEKNYPSLIALVLLVFVAYANSLGNDFVADDIPAILNNPNIGNLFFNIRAHPLYFLRYVFYFLAYQLGGLNPLFYRLINIVFHLGSVIAIYFLISFLHHETLALIAASLFAAHPIHTEAVTWVSGGLRTQYAFFALLSFLLYLRGEYRGSLPKIYWASLITFWLALLTSEEAAVLPLIIFSFELATGELTKIWKRIIPFVVLGGIWFGLPFLTGTLAQRAADLQTQHYLEGGFYNPLIQIPTAIYSYLRLIFWPDQLTLYHSEMSFTTTQYLPMVLITILFFGAMVYTFLCKNLRPYFFWLSFLVISLLPSLTPLKIAWVVAERYVYLGSLGILMLTGFAIQKVGQVFKNEKVSYVILAIVLLALSARTIVRNNDWKNQDTLWLASAKTSPSSPQNHNNLGDLYGRRGDLERSVEEFKKAIELNPNYADAYHNLGNTYLQMGKVEEAIRSFKKAAELNPRLWQSCQNLAAIYFEQGNFELAKEWMEKAVAANPEDPNLQRNLEIINAQLSNP